MCGRGGLGLRPPQPQSTARNGVTERTKVSNRPMRTEEVMELLRRYGIDRIFHFAPLHYLPFIARSRAIKSKPVLTAEGYFQRHFRSTSAHIDVARGFGNYVHLSSVPEPPILASKLGAGFPHVGIELVTLDLPEVHYDLCRFNIAKTRQLRRDGKAGFAESRANGRYYGNHQIPIARSPLEKQNMLAACAGQSMIEVLVAGQIPLPGSVQIRSYSIEDQKTAQYVLEQLDVDWPAAIVDTSCPYARSEVYCANVDRFIENAIWDIAWRGNGLEFDRL